MNFWKGLILWNIFLAILCGAMLYGHWGMMIIHEETHKTIYSYHNISSESHVGILYAYTSADQEEYDEKCDDVCMLSQNMVEVVGYHIASVIAVMWIMVGILILYFTFFFPLFQKT